MHNLNAVIPTEHQIGSIPFSRPPHQTSLKWFAVHVKARYEKFVGDAVQEKGYESFVPLYERRRTYGSSVKKSNLPLFPGYTFCRLNPSDRLPVLIIPGVIKILGTGKVPQPISDTEVSSLKRAAEATVEMSPCPFWECGQTGRITKGPLAGVEGMVMRHKGSYRLVLSVALLQRSVLLEIDSDSLALE